MRKKFFVVGGLLTFAFVLNISISMNQNVLSDLTINGLYNIALADSENGDGEGTISIPRDCEFEYYACPNPFDPTDCDWYTWYGTETYCLLGWPNLGCSESECY